MGCYCTTKGEQMCTACGISTISYPDKEVQKVMIPCNIRSQRCSTIGTKGALLLSASQQSLEKSKACSALLHWQIFLQHACYWYGTTAACHVALQSANATSSTETCMLQVSVPIQKDGDMHTTWSDCAALAQNGSLNVRFAMKLLSMLWPMQSGKQQW